MAKTLPAAFATVYLAFAVEGQETSVAPPNSLSLGTDSDPMRNASGTNGTIGYEDYIFKNCFSIHGVYRGAMNIDNATSDGITNFTAEQCEDHCSSTPWCTCFMYSAWLKLCLRRRDCFPNKCKFGPIWKLHVNKQANLRAIETSAPAVEKILATQITSTTSVVVMEPSNRTAPAVEEMLASQLATTTPLVSMATTIENIAPAIEQTCSKVWVWWLLIACLCVIASATIIILCWSSWFLTATSDGDLDSECDPYDEDSEAPIIDLDEFRAVARNRRAAEARCVRYDPVAPADQSAQHRVDRRRRHRGNSIIYDSVVWHGIDLSLGRVYRREALGAAIVISIVILIPYVYFSIHLSGQIVTDIHFIKTLVPVNFPTFANASVQWVNGTRLAVNWVPVDACPLPPPQPYYMEVGLGLIKIGLCACAFGVSSIDTLNEEPGLHEWIFTIVYGIYQPIMLLVSLALTLERWHNYQSMKPCYIGWDGFECLGTMLLTGPFIMNLLTNTTQYILTRELLSRMRSWSHGHAGRDRSWAHGQGKLTEVKAAMLYYTIYITAVPTGSILVPYFVTHIVPAIVIFLPEISVIGTTGALLSLMLGIDQSTFRVFLESHVRLQPLMEEVVLAEKVQLASQKALSEAKSRLHTAIKEWRKAKYDERVGPGIEPPAVIGPDSPRSEHYGVEERMGDGDMKKKRDDAQEAEKLAACCNAEAISAVMQAHTDLQTAKRNATGFRFVIFVAAPLLAALRVGVEVLFLQMAYVYSGIGYFPAVRVTWMERRASIYVDNFCVKVMASAWASSQLFVGTV